MDREPLWRLVVSDDHRCPTACGWGTSHPRGGAPGSKWRCIRGQSASEYALLISLLAVVSMLTLLTLGLRVRDVICPLLAPFGLDLGCMTLFSDLFDDLAAWQVGKGRWEIKDGKLCGGGGEGNILRDIPAEDYTITVSGASLANGPGYGVFFRASGAPNINGYTFQYDPGYGSGEFLFRKWVNGRELSPFARARPPGFDWYREGRIVKLVISGSTFTAYVDGQMVLQGSDGSFTNGAVGFRTWGATNVCFDGITVEP